MRRLPLCIIAVLTLVACSRTPGYVIPKDKMASLMADLYLGDAVVEDDYRTWGNDSVRRVLKQSIYAKHRVSAQQVDTSLYWYGHNIQQYMEMATLTEQLLQQRIDKAEMAGSRSDKAPKTLSVDGDSVNVWPGVRTRRNAPGQPSDYMPFLLTTDRNWERGDRYTLQVKGVAARGPLRMDMGVDYNDGTVEFRSMTVPADGMHRLLLVLDSAKVATNVYGTIHYAPQPDEVSYLDSITLVRTRGRNDNVAARAGQKVILNR